MTAVLEWLKGKKTYLQAAAGGIAVALNLAGLIDSTLLGTILTAIGLGMGASIAAKVDRSAAK